jgi:hypothetical protein
MQAGQPPAESRGTPSVVADQAQRAIDALDDHGRNSGVFLDKEFPALVPWAHAYDAMAPVMSLIKSRPELRRAWSDLVRDSRKPASDAQDLFHRLDAFVAALRAAVGGSKRGELTVPADRPRYHRPDEPRPERYRHGPLTGTKRELGYALDPRASTETPNLHRRLSYASSSPRFWIVALRPQQCEVFFESQPACAEASTRLTEIRSAHKESKRVRKRQTASAASRKRRLKA